MAKKTTEAEHEILNNPGFQSAIKTISTQLLSVFQGGKDVQVPQVNTAEILSLIQREVLQQLINAEMDSYIGRPKYQRIAADDVSEGAADTKEETLSKEAEHREAVSQARNYRNGSYKRKLRTDTGDITIAMPRDRNGGFDSAVAPKGVRDFAGLKEKILMLVSGGNSAQECSRILQSMLGVEVSHEYIHLVVQSFQDRLNQWRKRELKPFYPFMFVDCLYVPMRGEDGKVSNRAVYVVLGIDDTGHKELVHLDVGNGSEGKVEWLNNFSEMQSRGLKDVLFLSIDGISGVEEGVKAIFPNVTVQRCMVHIMRNSCELVNSGDRKEFCNDAKQLYQAHNFDEAAAAFKSFKQKWDKKAHGAVRIWSKHFDSHVSQLYDYPLCIRKVIYTTNAIESVNSSLRKVVKKGCFGTKESIMSVMLLRAENVLSDNWKRRTITNWAAIKNALLIHEKTAELMNKYCSDIS